MEEAGDAEKSADGNKPGQPEQRFLVLFRHGFPSPCREQRDCRDQGKRQQPARLAGESLLEQAERPLLPGAEHTASPASIAAEASGNARRSSGPLETAGAVPLALSVRAVAIALRLAVLSGHSGSVWRLSVLPGAAFISRQHSTLALAAFRQRAVRSHCSRESSGSALASGAAVSRQPRNAVVAESELQHRIVCAAPYIGPLVGRHGIYDCRPGYGYGQHENRRSSQHRQLLFPREAYRQQIEQIKSRKDHVRLEHLHVECRSDQGEGSQQAARPLPSYSSQQKPSRQQEREDEHRVDIVRSRHRDADRRERHPEGCDARGGESEGRLHEQVDEQHRADSSQRLRQNDAPAMQAEYVRERRLDPEGKRGFVHRHRAGGVQRAVEEVMPALQHAAYRSRVIRIGVGFLPYPVQVQKSGRQHGGGQHQIQPPAGSCPLPDLHLYLHSSIGSWAHCKSPK